MFYHRKIQIIYFGFRHRGWQHVTIVKGGGGHAGSGYDSGEK